MHTARLTQARRLFAHPGVPRLTQRHNIRQWVKSLRYLGDRWLLRTPVRRLT